MGEHTGISWTDATYNPWYGCTKVSPGCAHCYMFSEQRQYGRDPELVTRSKTKFKDPLKWKEPKRIFTCSWSDFFHEAADAWRPEVWDIIRRTPQHTYQILTKRPELVKDRLPADWGAGYPNVWLGVSVENQRWTSRIPILQGIPARLRFLSCEPLLGPVNFGEHNWMLDGIRWVICGGESGVDAREMNLNWAYDILSDCHSQGKAFFMKQMSGPRPGMRGDIPGDLWIQEIPT
jgi:protein gp37